MILKAVQRIVLICVVLFLSGCRCPLITAQTDYITRQHRASFRVGTPDPNLNHPITGQRLIIKWDLPENYLKYEGLHLEIAIRFNNLTEKKLSLPISTSRHTYIYNVCKEEFCSTNGIASYKIDLVGNGCILYKWRHQLWVESITIEE